MKIAGSLLYALANVLHPRMLWLMLWPVLVALAIWGTVAIVFWSQFVLWLSEVLRGWPVNAAAVVSFSWDGAAVALFAAKALALLALVPLVQLTALLILSAFGMQLIAEHVARRSFPALERRSGGSLLGSIGNGFVALAGLLLLGLLSLPLWIFPPLWPLIPVGVLGWVNQRVLRYDALAAHADTAEMREIFSSGSGALYLLGFLLALAAYVPLVGFFAPTVFGLAFTHLLLGRVAELRSKASLAGVPRIGEETP